MSNKNDKFLDYIDSMMVLDKNLNVIHTNRYNPRFDLEGMHNEYEDYNGKSYFEIYPDIKQHESTMIECLETGEIVFRNNQYFKDYKGRKYHTKNINYPIKRYGQIVGVIEISQDITSVDDNLKNITDQIQSDKRSKFGIEEIFTFDNIVTRNSEMLQNIEKAKVFAMNDNPLLIYGETGTGKDMFAQAIANQILKPGGKYVVQNCAAIPENLFESILFGTTKGSFTGAENKKGLFEIANNGIIFLDELNSMPIYLQAKLLRVIQNKTIRPVGSDKEIRVNVKIISAVNKDLESLIENKLLREDLFYRLSSNIINLSPLRDRKEDIQLYIDIFIKQYNKLYQKNIDKLTPELISVLTNYDWPGNVRELKHIIESMINLSNGDVLSVNNLPIYFKESKNVIRGTKKLVIQA